MPDLAWWLENFKESAFRLESLPAYSVPEEADMLAHFRRTGVAVLDDNHPWPPMVRTATQAGKRMQRVRVVSTPLSEYERFELALYPHSVACGEDIRILEDARFTFRSDFWLLDDEACFVMHYDETGAFLGVEQVDPAPYRERRRLALSWSIPLADYTARVTR